MDLVEEEDRPPARRARAARARARAPRARSPTVAETAESSSNSAPVVSATIRASVVLPGAGRAVEDRATARGRPRSRAAARGPGRSRAPGRRTRRASAAAAAARAARRSSSRRPAASLEEVAHGEQYAPGRGSRRGLGTSATYERLAAVLAPVQDELRRAARASARASAGSTSRPGGGEVALRAARAGAAGDRDRRRRADARAGARAARRRGARDPRSTSATSSTSPTTTASFDVARLELRPRLRPRPRERRRRARARRPSRRPPRLHRLEAEPEARRALPPLHRGAARGARGVRVGPRGPRRGHARRGLRARVRRRHALARGGVGRGDLEALLRVRAAGDRAARSGSTTAAPRQFHQAFVELYEGYRERRRRSARRAATCSSWARGKLSDEVVELLQELIRVDTTNPPGNETAAAELLARLPRGGGRRVRAVRARRPSGRTSSRASAARGDGPSLALLSHTDVVLADAREWERRPVRRRARDGEVWGRGALDMKGQVAARAVALATLAREGWRGSRRPGLHRRRRRGGRRRASGSSGSSRRTRTRCRADYSINEGGGDRVELGGRVALPVRDGREDERAVPPARARPQRARVDAVDRRQRARQGGAARRAARRASRPSRSSIPEVEAFLAALLDAACRRRRRGARRCARSSHPLAGELVEPLLGMTRVADDGSRVRQAQRDSRRSARSRSTAALLPGRRRQTRRRRCARASARATTSS